MAIDLRPDIESAIMEKVDSGSYPDADAVVRAAMRLLEEEEFRARIADAVASLDRGEGVELTPQVWDEIEREADEMLRRGEQPARHVCP